jgi:sigma54-dependent transcription regulator
LLSPPETLLRGFVVAFLIHYAGKYQQRWEKW